MRNLLLKISRQDPELLLKAFRKIGRRIKSYHVTDLIHLVRFFLEQLSGFFQTFHPDILVGCQVEYAFYFSIKTGTAHVELLGDIFHDKVGVVHIFKYDSMQLPDKFFVGFGKGHAVGSDIGMF